MRLRKFLGMNLLPFLWVPNMIYCPQCERKLPNSVEVCPNCGNPFCKPIKEPEGHGFRYLVVNPLEIPNDC
jgi:predicted amidophosphoribosyltransferase